MVEQTTMLVNNEFGSVTADRVIYNREKTWFSDGSREEIPMRHITGLRFETSRRVQEAIICFAIGVLVGLPLLYFTKIGFIIGGIIPIGLGIYFMVWAPPRVRVVVTTAGGYRSATNGTPSQAKHAEEFVEALRKELFK